MFKREERDCKSPSRRNTTSLTPFSIADILNGRSSRGENQELLEVPSRRQHPEESRPESIADILLGRSSRGEDDESRQDWDLLEATSISHLRALQHQREEHDVEALDMSQKSAEVQLQGKSCIIVTVLAEQTVYVRG